MSEVVVVATFRGKRGCGDQIEAGLQEAILRTHEEPGCVLYALHRGVDDRDLLVFVERWASQGDLARHAQQPWVTSLTDLSDLLETPVEVLVTAPRPSGDPHKGSFASA